MPQSLLPPSCLPLPPLPLVSLHTRTKLGQLGFLPPFVFLCLCSRLGSRLGLRWALSPQGPSPRFLQAEPPTNVNRHPPPTSPFPALGSHIASSSPDVEERLRQLAAATAKARELRQAAARRRDAAACEAQDAAQKATGLGEVGAGSLEWLEIPNQLRIA